MMSIASIEFILDTQAWLQYFLNAKHADRVETLFENHSCATPSVVIAELSHFFAYKKVRGWDKALSLIQTKTAEMQLDTNTADHAGKLKNEIRTRLDNNFGLIDAIILACAQEHNAKVVTGDYHFKKLENTIFMD